MSKATSQNLIREVGNHGVDFLAAIHSDELVTQLNIIDHGWYSKGHRHCKLVSLQAVVVKLDDFFEERDGEVLIESDYTTSWGGALRLMNAMTHLNFALLPSLVIHIRNQDTPCNYRLERELKYRHEALRLDLWKMKDMAHTCLAYKPVAHSFKIDWLA